MDWDSLPLAVVAAGRDLPAASRLVGGAVAGLSLVHVVLPTVVDEALALVPHHTIFSPVIQLPVPFCWNLVTGHLFEGYLLKALITAPTLTVLTCLLETLWTTKAILLHLLVTAACSSFCVCVIEVLEVIESQRYKEFFLPVQGSIGLLVAVAVGLRHAYPFEPLPHLPRTWGLQCQHLPFALVFAISSIGILFAPTWLPEWPFAPLALVFGWLNIRYFMWFPYASAYGDHSPDFAFAALFPNALRPAAGFLGAIVYRLALAAVPSLVTLRQDDCVTGGAIVYDPVSAKEDGVQLRVPGPGGHGPGGRASDDAAPAWALNAAGSDAEKAEYSARRAKALRLLDNNLASLLSATGVSAALGGLGNDSTDSERGDGYRHSAAQDIDKDL